MSSIDERPPKICPVCGARLLVAEDPNDPQSCFVVHEQPECDGFRRWMVENGAAFVADIPAGEPS